MTEAKGICLSRRRTRRYVAILFSILGVALTTTVFTNLVVNPWRTTPTFLSSDALDPYRDIAAQSRTGKCGLVRSAPSIGVAFIGSSRVANGFDPMLEEWKRDDVYNLAYPAGYFYEGEAMFRYLLEYHKPEMIIMGLDPGDLSSEFDSRGMGDYASSPLGPKNTLIDREIRYITGISTLESSIETIIRKQNDEKPQYGIKGLRRNAPELQISQLSFLANAIRGEAQFDLPDEGRRTDPLQEDKAKLLEEIIRTCRKEDIRLILFIHPQHALLHAALDKPPLLPFEVERREITNLVARLNAEKPGAEPTILWDFGNYHPINCDPLPSDDVKSRMKYWNDFNHFTIEIGTVMLGRMLDWPIEVETGESYGVQLTPDNFDEWKASAESGYKQYVNDAGITDLKWKKQIIEEAKNK